MRKLKYQLVLCCGWWVMTIGLAFSQTGEGSSTADNSTVVIVAGATEQRFSENSYFGPEAQWEINGTLEIWSKNIWIAPGASFKGTGKIIIHNPGDNPFYTGALDGPTVIDGNNGDFIGVAIELRNVNNLLLADIDDPGYDTSNPTGALAATLNIGNTLDLAVDGADVLLNGHNLGFDASGTVANYGPQRMVVTGNSIAGHVIKAYTGPTEFVYPVGIAEGDYTPAILRPNVPTTLAVSVQDYAASSALVNDEPLGMDRVWHSYTTTSTDVTVDYALQHNAATHGDSYANINAIVQQYAGAGIWTKGVTSHIATGVHNREGVVPVGDGTAPGSWLTKMVEICGGVITGQVFAVDGHKPLANVMVSIKREGDDAAYIRSYLTDPDGFYLFEGLQSGSYRVQVVDVNLGSAEGLFAVGDNFVDVDVADCAAQSHDFAYDAPATPIIGDFVWYDVNANGIMDEWYDANNDGQITQNFPNADGIIKYEDWEWIDLNGDGRWNGPENKGELNWAGIGNHQSENIIIRNDQGYINQTAIGELGFYREKPNTPDPWSDYEVELHVDEYLIQAAVRLAVSGLVKPLPETVGTQMSTNRVKSLSMGKWNETYGKYPANLFADAGDVVIIISDDGKSVVEVTTGTKKTTTVTPEDRIRLDVEFGIKVYEAVPIQANDDLGSIDAPNSLILPILNNDVSNSAPLVPSSFELVSGPSNGTVVSNADGTITYTPVFGFAGEDAFTYRVQDEYGLWSNVATVRITVTTNALFIPNIFTPNGDGNNETFEIIGIEAYDRVELTVINRWGNEVFRDRNYQNDWNGGGLNEGTYYYLVTLRKGDEETVHKGWVLIKRK